MSHIDDLIEELCPDGVPYKLLGKVGTFTRGSGLQKKDFTETGFPCIHYGQIYTHYGVWATEAKSFIDPTLAARLHRAQPGDLIIATTSENDEDVCKAVAWLGDGEVAVSNDACFYHHELDPKYVSYWFQSAGFQSQKTQAITGTKVRRVSAERLSRMRIPVPPMPVQQEIVRILDTFTTLESELEAELEARRLQYEHYCSTLLSHVALGARQVTLGDLGKVVTGRTPKASDPTLWNGTVDFVTPSDIKNGMKFIDSPTRHLSVCGAETVESAIVPANSILVTCIGADMGKTIINAHECVTNQQINSVVLDDSISVDYVFHILTSRRSSLLRQGERSGGTLPIINKTDFSKIHIPLPELTAQRVTAATLDTFDALVNDLTSGLPAEIAARHQQYEYYRDRLLTFKELSE